MDWFEKSSKEQETYDMESLGIRFEPIVFYPDRNEYELCIELSGCPEELVKATYEMGKLKVEGQKYTTKFVQEFSIPTDCLATKIYGQYYGEVLHIIMPRLISERSRSEKQEEDDRKATTKVGEDHYEVKGLARRIERINSSLWQKDDRNDYFDRERLRKIVSSTDKVKERGGKDQDNLTARVPAPSSSDQKGLNEREGKDRDKLLNRVSTLPSSDQKKRGKDHGKLSKVPVDQKEMKEREGKDRDKLLIRIPTIRVPTPLSPDQKERKEKEGKDRDTLPTRVPSPSPSDLENLKRTDELFSETYLLPSSPAKKLGENYQRNLSKTVEPPLPPPPPPPHAAAMTPWNQDATKIRQEEENAKNAKIVAESKDKESSKVTKPSGEGGNKMLGLVAKVKETGKAAVSAAMKEENRLVVMIGAAVLSIVVLGVSWRRRKKNQKLINL